MFALLGMWPVVQAQSIEINGLQRPLYFTENMPSFMMASNSSDSSNSHSVTDPELTSDSTFKFSEDPFNANKTHQYLGLAALGMATLSLLSPKEEDGAHENFANGAVLLGSAAIGTGFYAHWNDFTLKDGWRDPDNQHIALSGLGVLGFLLAVSNAPDGSHATTGGIGMVAMIVGIKLTW